MKPVAIFRSARTEGPGYFATVLERRSIEWKLIALDEGQPVPRDARAFSGMAFMGGPMSVNDDLPWIAPLLELMRDGVRKDVPALGHCLGGQLMSKAFGGVVGNAMGPFLAVTSETWAEMFELNVHSMFHTTRRAPQLRHR